MARKPLVAVAVPLLAACLAAPALAGGQGGFGPVDPASPNAERVNHAYWLIGALSVGILLVVTIPLVLFAIRYRSRGRPRTVEGPQVHGSTGFELAWTGAPIVILVVIAGFVFYKLPGITDPAAAGAEPVEIRVEGRQFYWRYVYDDGVVAVDTLRIPAGQLIELDMTAPDGDVIHSYWIPALFGKRDTIPGEVTDLRFVAKRPGLYTGQCGEFCGIQHALMEARVEALPPDEFESWLAEQQETQQQGGEQLGEALWEAACLKCHRLDEQYVGPALRGNPILADREALEELVRNGQGEMPAVAQGWTEREIDALHAYTEQFATGGGDGAEGDGGES